MTDERYFYEPSQGHGLPHNPFNAIVGPRPIGWISSRSADGVLNLAPYSFFNGFNYTPPLVGFCSIGRKDSLNNIEQTGEFVWNLVTRPLAEAMNASCAPAPPQVDEFQLAGLTPVASRVVKVPRDATGVRPASWNSSTCGGAGAQLAFIASFFFNDTATTEIYTLSLHDALPI